MKKHDTREGILEFLEQGLAGLGALQHLRQNDHGELHDWIILGSYQLSSTGQVWRLRERVITDPEHRVCTIDELHGQQISDLSCSPSQLPSASDVCTWCRGSWDLHNVHDFMTIRNVEESAERTWLPYHVACRQLQIDERIGEKLLKAIYAASFSSLIAHPPRLIPNLYPDQNGPWYLLGGDALAVVVGWRRRVISISWDRGSLDIDGTQLFADVKEEGTTVDHRLVHAWGYDKATEYLRRLDQAIKDRRST